jgi:hypothetical protein
MNYLKSKTVLFGLLLTIASIAQMLVPFLPPEHVGLVGTGVGIAVIVLRFLTSIPISEK